jgi:DNA-binding response OmpR family regulator
MSAAVDGDRLNPRSVLSDRDLNLLHSLQPIVMAAPPDVVSTPRVLIVEDERKTRESLTEGLSIEAWSVSAVETGGAAITALREHGFDLVVLDWTLPDQDGLEIVKYARSRGVKTPVLMLTARDSLNDRVKGLESGADDYLGKPFAFAELLARCRALLRRTSASASGHLLRCADLQLDTRARVAVRGDEEVALTPREVDMLEYLLRYQGQVVTREMLERDVWKQSQRFSSLDNVIDVQIMRLRRKIDFSGVERLIHTLRGVGYRLGKEPA